MYCRLPTETPAVGMTVISTLSIFWLGMSSLAWPGTFVAALWKLMPSARLVSLLRRSTWLRQSLPLPPGGAQVLPNVSPKAARIWPEPLSHMTPRSVE